MSNIITETDADAFGFPKKKSNAMSASKAVFETDHTGLGPRRSHPGSRHLHHTPSAEECSDPCDTGNYCSHTCGDPLYATEWGRERDIEDVDVMHFTAYFLHRCVNECLFSHQYSWPRLTSPCSRCLHHSATRPEYTHLLHRWTPPVHTCETLKESRCNIIATVILTEQLKTHGNYS